MKPSRRRLLPWCACAALCCAVGACRSSSSQPPGQGETPASPAAPAGTVPDPFVALDAQAAVARDAAAPSAKATVRLVEPGRAPRRKLRYAWRADRSETLTIDLRTTASTESEGERPPDVPLPPVRIVVAIVPQDVAGDGTLVYRWRVASASVTPVPGANPQLAEGMEAEVAAIAHLAGSTTVSSRGLAEDVHVEPSSVTDSGATGQMVEQIRQTLRDLCTPFPEEEVGAGGHWEKRSHLASATSVVTQSESFTLASLSADRGTVEDVLAQTSPPQDLPSSRADPARLESMLATGTGTSHFDLTRIVPATNFSGTTTMVVSGRSPGDPSRRVTMILRVEIALSGTAP